MPRRPRRRPRRRRRAPRARARAGAATPRPPRARRRRRPAAAPASTRTGSPGSQLGRSGDAVARERREADEELERRDRHAPRPRSPTARPRRRAPFVLVSSYSFDYYRTILPLRKDGDDAVQAPRQKRPPRQRARARHDDLRPGLGLGRGRRREPAHLRRATTRPAATSSTPPTTTPTARARPSSASSPRAERERWVIATKYSLTLDPRRPERRRQPPQEPRALARAEPAPPAARTTSTCSGCTCATRRRRSRRPCARSTTRCGSARCSTSASPTRPRGSPPRRTRSPTCAAGRRSSRCRSRTASRAATRSASSCRWRRRSGSTLVPWGVLGAGILTGKPAAERRWPEDRVSERTEALVERPAPRSPPTTTRRRRRSRSRGCSARAARRRSCPIVGARTEAQIVENLGALELELDGRRAQRARRGRRAGARLPALVPRVGQRAQPDLRRDVGAAGGRRALRR